VSLLKSRSFDLYHVDSKFHTHGLYTHRELAMVWQLESGSQYRARVKIRQIWDCRQFVGLWAPSKSGKEDRRYKRQESGSRRKEWGMKDWAREGLWAEDDRRYKATVFSRLLTFQHYLELEYRGPMCSRGKSSFGRPGRRISTSTPR